MLGTAQPGDGCPLLFQQQPRLLVCSTPLHRGQQIYADFYTAWQVILGRHPSTVQRTVPTTSITTPTTMINYTSLSNETKIFIKKEKIVEQNETNKNSLMFPINSSNGTNETIN